MIVGLRKTNNMVRIGFRLSMAICDQALFAGSSFIFTLLLARWMQPAEFGAYVITYSVYALFQNAFDGLLSEPLSVFGSGRFSTCFSAYLGRMLIASAVVGVGTTSLSILGAAILGVLGMDQLAKAFAGLAVAGPFLCIRSLIRQPFYIRGNMHLSVIIGVLHMASSTILLWLVHDAGWLNPFNAYLPIGFGAAGASGIAVLFCVRPVWHSTDPELAFKNLIRTHLDYGRWAMLERSLLWMQTNAGSLLLGLAWDLYAAAVYRAASTLIMPAYMAITSMGSVLLPTLSRSVAQEPSQTRPWWQQHLAVLLFGATSAYAVPLACFGSSLAHELFAGRYDAECSPMLMVGLGLGALTFAVNIAIELQLRASLRVKKIVVARAFGTVVSLTIGTSLTIIFGVAGAVAATVVTWSATTATLCFLLTVSERLAQANLQRRSVQQGGKPASGVLRPWTYQRSPATPHSEGQGDQA
jgi:O-antigen/teichoic acid export membrane protein